MVSVNTKTKYKTLAIYCTAVGILYLIYGVIEFTNGFITWWTPSELNIQFGVKISEDVYIPNTMADPFAGLVLIIVGSIILRTAKHVWNENTESWGFATVSLLLAGAVAVLSISIITADCLDAYYPLLWGGEPNDLWNFLGDPWSLNPGLVLFPLTIPLFDIYRKAKLDI